MTTTEAKQVVLRRTYDAPSERVFEAWTDPALLARWYTPGDGWEMSVLELDLRVGGRFLVRFGAPGETPYEESGEYLEIRRPARLAFTTILRRAGEIIEETRCEVDFLDLGGRTEVVLTEVGSDPAHLEDRRQGWGETLDHLYPVLGAA